MTPSRPRQEPRRTRPQAGFSLLELIIVLMIVIILTAFAAPAMQELNIRSVVTTNTNDLITALSFARAEAVKRGRDVAVVSAGGNWTDGWTIQTTAATPETLVSHLPVKQDYRVLGAATGTGSVDDRVIFTATGALRTATAFEFSVCRPSFDPGNAQSRRIIITATGSVRTRRDTSSSLAGSCA